MLHIILSISPIIIILQQLKLLNLHVDVRAKGLMCTVAIEDLHAAEGMVNAIVF